MFFIIIIALLCSTTINYSSGYCLYNSGQNTQISIVPNAQNNDNQVQDYDNTDNSYTIVLISPIIETESLNRSTSRELPKENNVHRNCMLFGCACTIVVGAVVGITELANYYASHS